MRNLVMRRRSPLLLIGVIKRARNVESFKFMIMIMEVAEALRGRELPLVPFYPFHR